MNRIRVLLALSHLLLLAAATLFYYPGTLWGIPLLLIGGLTRSMTPKEKRPRKNVFLFLIFYPWGLLLANWLNHHGVKELLASAWHDRYSLQPFILYLSALIYMVIKDWIYLSRLTESEIDSYYETDGKKEA